MSFKKKFGYIYIKSILIFSDVFFQECQKLIEIFKVNLLTKVATSNKIYIYVRFEFIK